MKQAKRKRGRPRKTVATDMVIPNDWSQGGQREINSQMTAEDMNEMNFAIVDAIVHSQLTTAKKLALINIVATTFNS
jgi:hypothetical protein